MFQTPTASQEMKMKLSLSLTRDTRETPSNEAATSNQKQQEPIDEGTTLQRIARTFAWDAPPQRKTVPGI